MFDFINKLSRLKLRLEFEEPPAATVQAPKAQAHFEIIGLDRVREKYSAHWNAIRERVHQIVRLIIKKHLTEGETFDVLPPEQYVVTFLRNGAEATIAAERIRQSIITVFLKDAQLMEHLDVGVRVTELTPSVRQASIKEEKNRSVNEDDLEFCKPSKQYENGHEKPMFIRASIPDSNIHYRGTNKCGLETRPRPPLVRDENGAAILPSPLEFPFRPVWRLGKDVPGCFSTVIRHTMDGGTVLEGYDVLPEDADEDMILDLDLRTLRKLRIAMNATKRSCGVATKMMCPVHYKTVSDEKRATVYAEAFNTLRAESIDDAILLQLMHMPRALYGNDLQKPIQALWKMTKQIIIMTPLDRSERDGLAQAGVTSVGVDIEPYAHNPLQVVQTRMRAYTKIANRERMRTFVTGLDREDLLEAAKAAGFTNLCGSALATQQDTPTDGLCPVSTVAKA